MAQPDVGGWWRLALTRGQICGLVVTQYNPDTGSTYPLGTYLILIFQVFLSASSGVYNQALLKSDDSSLHADNMVLYAAGASINFVCHVVVRILKADEPGFFSGYDSFGAVMVIVSNVFIGLAITAVYKCSLRTGMRLPMAAAANQSQTPMPSSSASRLPSQLAFCSTSPRSCSARR